MAVYNTASDAANTAVRAYLTSVGEYYLQGSFNTATGKGKKLWTEIQQEFDNACAYCGNRERMQIEHLVMFNRSEYGLHHPGNVVPVCKLCNERRKDDENRYVTWPAHLAFKCGGAETMLYLQRKARIDAHIERYRYPLLSEQERHAIAVIAESLYANIKTESEKSLRLYLKLDEAFVRRSRGVE